MPQTLILAVSPTGEPEPAIARAAALLREGKLVAFPTETVYGLGADATNPRGRRRHLRRQGASST